MGEEAVFEKRMALLTQQQEDLWQIVSRGPPVEVVDPKPKAAGTIAEMVLPAPMSRVPWASLRRIEGLE